MGQPAARVGDMHICPMFDGPKPHVGGPILPPGVPTVLIGGMPAAIVTGKCTCASPAPDVIVKGSLGVFIGGKPAARLGDMTAHGGTITVGCPTVLIGDLAPVSVVVGLVSPCAILNKLQQEPTTGAEAAEQAKLQQDLEDAVFQNMHKLPKDQQHAALDSLQQYQENVDVLGDAVLSQAVYGENDYGSCGKTPCGYTKVDPADYDFDEKYLDSGLDKKYLHCGFKAAIYKTPKGETVVAFAGTDMTLKDGPADFYTDLMQGVGAPTDQYDRAMIIGDNMQDALGPEGFRTTGHSLGGGLASAVSATTGAKGRTYNAAGLHQYTTQRDFGVSNKIREKNEKNVDAYYNSHDPLNRLQDNRKTNLGVVGWIANKIFGPFGSFGVKLVEITGGMPKAYGNRKKIPSKKKGLMEHGIQDVIDLMADQVNDNLNDLKNQFGCS